MTNQARSMPRESESGQRAPEQHIGRVPVRNLWLLMLYASDLFRIRRDLASVNVEDSPDELPDLVAKLLADAVERRQHRRLSLGYRSRESVLNRVRGRIDVLKTERHQLLARGLVACRFDELTVDTPRNRFVRAALECISKRVRNPNLAHRCRELAADMKLMGVSGNPPTRTQINSDRFGRHDAEDQYMVAAAKLAIDLGLPTETAGQNVLSMPDREETWIRGLFEKAVGGFYDVVLAPQGWRVRCGTPLGWQITAKTDGIDHILPSMRTDVVLDHPETAKRVVIDTKFTSIVTTGWHREESLRSGYLYQIYAYLHSQIGAPDPLAERASGLLLHPSIGHSVDETVIIQGHAIRFATVDLTSTPTGIRQQLLHLVNTQVASGIPLPVVESTAD